MIIRDRELIIYCLSEEKGMNNKAGIAWEEKRRLLLCWVFQFLLYMPTSISRLPLLSNTLWIENVLKGEQRALTASLTMYLTVFLTFCTASGRSGGNRQRRSLHAQVSVSKRYKCPQLSIQSAFWRPHSKQEGCDCLGRRGRTGEQRAVAGPHRGL